jgi:hypothetical protein
VQPPNVPPSDLTPAPQYEFTPGQNVVIGDLARKMSLVGMVLIVIGVLSILGALGRLIGGYFEGGFLGGLLFILIGVWTRGAADDFRMIVSTEGRDVTHLMRALENLRKMYDLIYIVIVVMIALALATGIAALVYVMMNRS